MWKKTRALAGIVLAGLIAGGIAVDRFGTREELEKAPVIVVLGARVLEGGVASGPLRSRAERAVDLYRRGLADTLLFSGGVGDFPPSEASLARDIAVSLGVPSGACILEEESHSTAENARFSARILGERGVRKVLLVSDPYHLFRARQSFRLEGIEAIPVPALLTERHRKLSSRAYWTLREVLALLRRPALLMARAPTEPTAAPPAPATPPRR